MHFMLKKVNSNRFNGGICITCDKGFDNGEEVIVALTNVGSYDCCYHLECFVKEHRDVFIRLYFYIKPLIKETMRID